MGGAVDNGYYDASLHDATDIEWAPIIYQLDSDGNMHKHWKLKLGGTYQGTHG